MKLYSDPDEPRQSEVVQFELEEWIDSSPFERLLGVQILSAEEGQAHLSLPFTLKLSNGGGVMHGGALTSLADTAVAMAIKSLLPPGTVFATTDLSMQFIAPVLEGQVHAYASVRETGERSFNGECALLGEDDETYALLTTVFKVSRQDK
ncbi:PaaI family thioesterase [Deltaproteobacteria bacterium IMCC39524]|nr:PaaI family thioesterase [Deltaproteobacteria bacterium IMCC39524]